MQRLQSSCAFASLENASNCVIAYSYFRRTLRLLTDIVPRNDARPAGNALLLRELRRREDGGTSYGLSIPDGRDRRVFLTGAKWKLDSTWETCRMTSA